DEAVTAGFQARLIADRIAALTTLRPQLVESDALDRRTARVGMAPATDAIARENKRDVNGAIKRLKSLHKELLTLQGRAGQAASGRGAALDDSLGNGRNPNPARVDAPQTERRETAATPAPPAIDPAREKTISPPPPPVRTSPASPPGSASTSATKTAASMGF